MALSAYRDALRALSHAPVPPAVRALDEIVTRGRAIADAFAALEAGRTDVAPTSLDEALAVAALCDAFVQTYFAELDFPPALFEELRTAERELLSVRRLRRLTAAQIALSAGRRNDTLLGTESGLVPYILRHGDTLERLALMTLGDVGRLRELVDLNDLDYPFLLCDRPLAPGDFVVTMPPEFVVGEFQRQPHADRRHVAMRVRVTGDLLMLPPDAIVPAEMATFTALDVELFGRDLWLENGRFQVTQHGEYQTLEAVPNLLQALRHRLATVEGELVLHPAYGMRRALALGVEGTRANVLLSGVETARTVLEDPRIVRVHGLELAFADGVNRATMQAETIGPAQRTIPLNLVIPEVVTR